MSKNQLTLTNNIPTFTCADCGHSNPYVLDACEECGKRFAIDRSEFIRPVKREAPKAAQTAKRNRKGLIAALVILALMVFYFIALRPTPEQQQAERRLRELQRRTEQERRGVDTGSSDPLKAP